ncbi:MAG: helix-turn-helix domain-containing protein [Deltaproteobacteria bacterium]|jgi:excisionase family DNA binding protein|nr:helix-turn-helix domain-containing protein [Deltaproteobacteria bacterium]
MENNLKLITVKELSDIIRLKKSSIYSLVYRRAIPYVKINSKTLFRLSDIEKFIEQNTHEPLKDQLEKINTNRKIK